MSGSRGQGPAVEIAVDNDVVLKAACYGLALRFWRHADDEAGAGVLGAARFVLAKVLSRGSLVRDAAAVSVALEQFFRRAMILEPDDGELSAAAELERLAQRAGLELDVGESQLAAIVASRDIALLDTGDKRAVRGFEALTGASPVCAKLRARIRCLEQLFVHLLNDAPGEFEAISCAVCAEPDVDKAISICFSCYSGGGADRDSVRAALESYVSSLRSEAPTVLSN